MQYTWRLDWLSKYCNSIAPRYWNQCPRNSPWPVQVLSTINSARNLCEFQCLGTKAALYYLLRRICGSGGKFLAAIFVRVWTFCKFFCLIYSTHMRNAHVDVFGYKHGATDRSTSSIDCMHLEAYTCVRNREEQLIFFWEPIFSLICFVIFGADFMIAS
jgi:hypothetical protein